MANLTEPTAPREESPTLLFPGRAPKVTYAIIGVTLAVFALQMGTKILLGVDLPAGIGIKDNDLIRAGQLWRLFTPMLLHDNSGLMHIGFNMYFLFVVGRQIEQLYGGTRYFLLYLLSGFAGAALSFVFSPYRAWGASTALFGLLGAQAVFGWSHRMLLDDKGRTIIREALSIVGINVVLGFIIGADNWGHIGGLLGGAMFAWFGGPQFIVERPVGVQPRLTDQRGLVETLNASVLVFGTFSALVAAGIFLLP